MSGGIREGSIVETPQGQGTVLALDWQKHPDPTGRLRDHAFVWVKLADKRVRLYTAADIHPITRGEVNQ